MAVSTLSLLWTVAAMVSYLFMQDNHGPWFPPATWAMGSLCLWSAYISSRNWETIGLWDKRQFLWGCISAVGFLYFLQFDPTFQVSCSRALLLLPALHPSIVVCTNAVNVGITQYHGEAIAVSAS